MSDLPARYFARKDIPFPALWGVGVIAVVFLVWEFVGEALWKDSLLPSQILSALRGYMEDPRLPGHVGATLARVFSGGLLGLCGYPLGVLLMLSPVGRAVCGILFPAAYSTSKVAVLYAFIVAFGIYEESKVALNAWAVFLFLVILSAQEARSFIFLRQGTERSIILDSAYNWGMTRTAFYWRILLPECLPALFRGLRFGFTASFMILVVSEASGTRQGLGYLVFLAYTDADIPGLIAATILLMLACCATWATVWASEKKILSNRGSTPPLI